MSDENTPWAPPGGAPGPQGTPQPSEPAVPAQPRYGEYAPPGWTPPPQAAWPPPAQGWTPPPQPGLVPLRPLGLGDVTAAAFRVLRRNPRPTFGFALVISAITGVFSAVVVGLVTWAALGRVDMAATGDVQTIEAGSVLLILLAAIVAALVQFALSALPQGIVALEVSRGTIGERLRLPELWRRSRGRIGALLGWMLLVAVVVLVALVVAIVPLVTIAVSGGPSSIVTVLGVGALLAVGFVVLSVWLGTKLEFVVPLIVVERLPIGAAMRRSWALTRGNFWRIFGITLLINVILFAAMQIALTPFSVIGTLAATVINPNQSLDTLNTTTLVIAIVSLVAQIVLGALVLVPQAAVPALLYLDARMRREGLDLVLQRHAEAKATGAEPPDPFD